MNAAFGQVADSKVVMECFRELAGLRARRGFQLHGQRAAQGKAKDGGGIGFIFRIESQGKQGIALLVHFLVVEAPFRSARYAVGRRAFLRTKPGPADGNPSADGFTGGKNRIGRKKKAFLMPCRLP